MLDEEDKKVEEAEIVNEPSQEEQSVGKAAAVEGETGDSVDTGSADSNEGKEEDPTIAAAQAEAVLEANKQRRASMCAAEIKMALEKHKCEIDVSMVIKKSSVEPQVSILAL